MCIHNVERWKVGDKKKLEIRSVFQSYLATNLLHTLGLFKYYCACGGYC